MNDQEVLLNPSTGQYHLLNRTGKLVVESWAEGAETDEAVGRLVQQGADAGAVQEDVARFIAALDERGLITRAV